MVKKSTEIARADAVISLKPSACCMLPNEGKFAMFHVEGGEDNLLRSNFWRATKI